MAFEHFGGWLVCYKIWEERYFRFILLQLYKQVRKNSSAIFSSQRVRIAHTIPFPFLNTPICRPLSGVLRVSRKNQRDVTAIPLS